MSSQIESNKPIIAANNRLTNRKGASINNFPVHPSTVVVNLLCLGGGELIKNHYINNHITMTISIKWAIFSISITSPITRSSLTTFSTSKYAKAAYGRASKNLTSTFVLLLVLIKSLGWNLRHRWGLVRLHKHGYIWFLGSIGDDFLRNKATSLESLFKPQTQQCRSI